MGILGWRAKESGNITSSVSTPWWQLLLTYRTHNSKTINN